MYHIDPSFHDPVKFTKPSGTGKIRENAGYHFPYFLTLISKAFLGSVK